MAKLALATIAFLAVFTVLVLVAGSIPPQRTTQAGGDLKPATAGRGHVVHHDSRD
jgi:hypothetical protein